MQLSVVVIFVCVVTTAFARSEKSWSKILKRLENAVHRRRFLSPYISNQPIKMKERYPEPNFTGRESKAEFKNTNIKEEQLYQENDPDALLELKEPDVPGGEINERQTTNTTISGQKTSTTMSPNTPSTTIGSNNVSTITSPTSVNTTMGAKNSNSSKNSLAATNQSDLEVIRRFQEFKCPTLEIVLPEFFKDFPNITDMSWNTSIKLDDLRGIMEKTVRVYNTLKNGRLALAQMSEDLARYVISKRMVCPASKFRQIMIYVIRRKLERSLSHDNDSLFKVLREVMRNISTHADEEFIRTVIKSVNTALFGEIIYPLQRSGYGELAGFIEMLYMITMDTFLSKHIFPNEKELFQILNYTAGIHQRAFSCTPGGELLSKHSNVIGYLSGYSGERDYRMYDIIREEYMAYFLHHDIGPEYYDLEHGMAQAIVNYSHTASKYMREILTRLDVNSPVNLHVVFKTQLNGTQLKILKQVEASLKGDEWRYEVDNILGRLRKYQANPNPDELKQIIKDLQHVIDKKSAGKPEAKP